MVAQVLGPASQNRGLSVIIELFAECGKSPNLIQDRRVLSLFE
jgi:hypothetical protein